MVKQGKYTMVLLTAGAKYAAWNLRFSTNSGMVVSRKRYKIWMCALSVYQ